MIAQIDSLFDLMATFPDEQACVEQLKAIRWQDGEFCPHCGDNRVYHFSDRKTFKCGACRKRFSIKVGTIFRDTKLPIRKWFIAIWLITNHPKGVASTTLAKDLKITQKSAWFVLHRLRHAARTNSFNAPLKGTVEADTTFVGGKEKNKHGKDRKVAPKAALARLSCSAALNAIASFALVTSPIRRAALLRGSCVGMLSAARL